MRITTKGALEICARIMKSAYPKLKLYPGKIFVNAEWQDCDNLTDRTTFYFLTNLDHADQLIKAYVGKNTSRAARYLYYLQAIMYDSETDGLSDIYYDVGWREYMRNTASARDRTTAVICAYEHKLIRIENEPPSNTQTVRGDSAGMGNQR